MTAVGGPHGRTDTTLGAPERAAPEGAGRAEVLGVIARLFARLHAERIAYCHWKSNEHLGPSLLALTDLDVLVDRAAAASLPAVLADLGFKRFAAKPGRGYPGVEDYVGFDEDTGRLTHLHLHYQLTLGERYLKGHRLPWERPLLETRVWDEAAGVYVAEPHLELVLLLVRSALKAGLRERVLRAADAPVLRGGQLHELRWLAARVEPRRLVRVAEPLVGARAAELLPAMLRPGGPTFRDLRALRRSASPGWDAYRLYDPPEARARRWLRELSARAAFLTARVRRLRARPSPRVLPHGGLIVALLGPDGAGKSTLAAELTRWLSRELSVLAVYGGSGSGRMSATRRVLQWMSARLRGARAAPAGAEGDRPAPRRGARAAAQAWRALLLADERSRTVTQARRARDLGWAVIADRFPQRQFPGVNDGPSLGHLSGAGGLLARAARREETAYADMERTAPDLVVKLRLPAEVALRRKPDTPPARLHRKLEVVRLLRFPPSTRVVEVDATLPLEQVLLRVKRAVWEAI